MTASSTLPSSAGPLLRFDAANEPRHGLPVLKISGELTEEGWPGMVEEFAKVAGPIRFLDFTGVTHCRTSSEDAAFFGRQVARQTGASPAESCHLLVAPDDLLFGLCRVIQVNLDMARVKAAVFRSVSAAMRWLEEEKMLPPASSRHGV